MAKKIFKVSWYDHWIDHSEKSEAKLLESMEDELMIQHTVGYYIGENKRYVLIAHEYNELNNQYSDTSFILKTDIFKRKRLN